MTHDELLEEIDLMILASYAASGFAEYAADGTKAEQALRAVVELHKPMKEPKKSGWFEGGDYKEGYVIGCEFDNYHYPCPTIQAIEKELQ